MFAFVFNGFLLIVALFAVAFAAADALCGNVSNSVVYIVVALLAIAGAMIYDSIRTGNPI